MKKKVENEGFPGKATGSKVWIEIVSKDKFNLLINNANTFEEEMKVVSIGEQVKEVKVDDWILIKDGVSMVVMGMYDHKYGYVEEHQVICTLTEKDVLGMRKYRENNKKSDLAVNPNLANLGKN